MGSTYTLLGTVTVSSSTNTTQMTFSNISSGYTDLVLLGNVRGNNTNFTTYQNQVYCRINNISTNIYHIVGLQWSPNTIGGIYTNGQGSISSGNVTVPWQNAPTGQFSQLRAYFSNYAELSTRKSGRFDLYSGFNTNAYTLGTPVSWSTDTEINGITEITVFVSGGFNYFSANSQLRLYGINRNA